MNAGVHQKNMQSRDQHGRSPFSAHLERRYEPHVQSLPSSKFRPTSHRANASLQHQSHETIHGLQRRPCQRMHSSEQTDQTVKSYKRFSTSPHLEWQPHHVATRRDVFGAWIFGSQTSFASDHSIQLWQLCG